VDAGKDKDLIYEKINRYVLSLRDNNVSVWRLYLFGSVANGTHGDDSDIDLAIFLDKDDIDGFDEDIQLMKLRRSIDLRIEPHSFARSDFDPADPFIREIVETGIRIV
jgi:uncharacterized protein